jgi:hypothetical protein
VKKLFIKSNPLEKHPNYRYEILQHFRSLKLIDDIELPADALSTLLHLQEFIGGNLIDWVGSLIELDTALEGQSENKQFKPQRLQKLVTLFTELTAFYEKNTFQNKSLLEKGFFIEQILK